MYPGLPQPPQIPGPQQGHPAQNVGVIQGNTSGVGQGLAGLSQGLSQFVQQYMIAQKKAEEDAMTRVEKTLQLNAAGVPIDRKQLLKDIKKAKLPIATDPENMQIAPVQGPSAPPQGVPSGEQMLLAPQGMGMSPNVAAMNALQVPQRMEASAGAQPQFAGPNAMGKYLDLANALGMGELAYKGQHQEVQKKMLDVLQSALGGDPRATEMATRAGLFKAIGPRDETFLLAHKMFPDLSPEAAQGEVGRMMLYDMMGGPEAERQYRTMAEKLAPRFGGDVEKAYQYVQQTFGPTVGKPGEAPKPRKTDSTLRPSYTFEEMKQAHDITNSITDRFPDAGVPAQMAADALLSGDRDAYMKIALGIPQYFKTKDQIAQGNWQSKFQQDASQHGDRMKMEQARINQAQDHFNKTYQMENLKFMQSKAQAEFDNAWKIYSDKDASKEAKNEAVDMLAEALMKQGVKVGTNEITKWFGPNQRYVEVDKNGTAIKKFNLNPLTAAPSGGDWNQFYNEMIKPFVVGFGLEDASKKVGTAARVAHGGATEGMMRGQINPSVQTMMLLQSLGVPVGTTPVP